MPGWTGCSGLLGVSGVSALAYIRKNHQSLPTVIVSAVDDAGIIRRAIQHGASGFIPKSSQRDVMLSAFKLIFSGGIYVPPEILGPSQPAIVPATQRNMMSINSCRFVRSTRGSSTLEK